MKPKNIQADIKKKSIKEAQDEINQILTSLEEPEANLEDSKDKYSRVLFLNQHINELFKQKGHEIQNSNFTNNSKKLAKK